VARARSRPPCCRRVPTTSTSSEAWGAVLLRRPCKTIRRSGWTPHIRGTGPRSHRACLSRFAPAFPGALDQKWYPRRPGVENPQTRPPGWALTRGVVAAESLAHPRLAGERPRRLRLMLGPTDRGRRSARARNGPASLAGSCAHISGICPHSRGLPFGSRYRRSLTLPFCSPRSRIVLVDRPRQHDHVGSVRPPGTGHWGRPIVEVDLGGARCD
jgi:hypothetical protein